MKPHFGYRTETRDIVMSDHVVAEGYEEAIVYLFTNKHKFPDNAVLTGITLPEEDALVICSQLNEILDKYFILKE